MRSLVISAVLVAALAGCGSSSSPCGDGVAVPQLTLTSGGLTIEVSTAGYALTVRDASGAALVTGGNLGWTSGTFGVGKALYNGYFFFEPHFDPWRAELKVVAASQTATSLDVTLRGADDVCVKVSHIVRDGALRVEAHADGVTPRAWQVGFASPATEGFLGLGERYDRVDHRGLAVYNWPEEGGLTNGEAEPPGPNNPIPNGGTMTYYPVPFFLSTAGYGFWLDTTYFNQFELATEAPDAWRAWEVGPTLAFEIYAPRPSDTRPWPLQLLDTFTAATGRPMIPPAWSFGPRRRINANGMVGAVSEIQAMRDQDLAITQADDTLHFQPDGSDLGHEAEIRAWVKAANDLGYKMIGYFNPYFASDPASPLATTTAAGIASGYFLKAADGTPGTVTLISGSLLSVYTVDVTFPDAVTWFTHQFQRALDLGYAGWMYDFGEYVQGTWTSHDGQTGVSLHNAFPVLYDRAAHDALEQLRPGDWYYYARAGYTGAQQYAPMTWSGDPDASFGQAEGLPAQVRAAITLSMSGVAHVGSDIGGYKCQHNGVDTANGELLARWIEAGAMSSDMHDEDACSGGGTKATIWSSPEAQTAWRTYARLHTRLQPYLSSLAATAHATGAPVVMSPYLLHPERRELATVDAAFYFGPSLYAVPVVTRGATTVTTTLPPGNLIDWRDGTLYAGGLGGVTATLPAPITELPLLLVDGGLLPLLDPTIDTLATETSAAVIGPTDVADVYDVVGAISKATGHAGFTLAGGATLAASYDGAAIACAGCTVTRVGPRVQRVQVEATADVAAGGLALHMTGVTRRVRWDVYVID
jgi:alpha-glucosidase (family GH31 glycosyl hydrolase)